jgi:hypothetical protein
VYGFPFPVQGFGMMKEAHPEGVKRTWKACDLVPASIRDYH